MHPVDAAAFLYVLPLAVGVLAAGRVTRLLTQDHWPPAVWLRLRWITFCGRRGWVEDPRDWSLLATCPWCLGPWVAFADLAWWLLAGGWVLSAWWVVNVALAAAYLVSMVVVRDEPE